MPRRRATKRKPVIPKAKKGLSHGRNLDPSGRKLVRFPLYTTDFLRRSLARIHYLEMERTGKRRTLSSTIRRVLELGVREYNRVGFLSEFEN